MIKVLIKETRLRMRSFRLLFIFLVGLSFAGASSGQTTSLQAALSRGPDARLRITLTNTYTADARAYIVECEYPGSRGTLTHVVWHEGLGGPPYTVWAGKTQTIACPLNTSQVEVKAVAYDDGKTEGDPQFVARIAAERQLEAQDVAEDIQILQDALSTLGASPSLASVRQLVSQFSARAQQHANSALASIPTDFVCSGIATMLSTPVHRQPITVLIQGYIAELQKFAAELPKPSQVSPQASTN